MKTKLKGHDMTERLIQMKAELGTEFQHVINHINKIIEQEEQNESIKHSRQDGENQEGIERKGDS
jgi:hypothetical protein